MKHLLNKETSSYLVTGILTTLINYIIYFLLTKWSVHFLVANTVAWVYAVIFSYVVNRRIVFGSKNNLLHEFFSFVLLRLFTLLMENVFLFCFIQLANFPDGLSKVAVSIVTVCGNYIFCKCTIFRKGEKTNE